MPITRSVLNNDVTRRLLMTSLCETTELRTALRTPPDGYYSSAVYRMDNPKQMGHQTEETEGANEDGWTEC